MVRRVIGAAGSGPAPLGKYLIFQTDAAAQHPAAEMFTLATGAPVLHMPFKGSSPAIIAGMADRIDTYFEDVVSRRRERLRSMRQLLNSWSVPTSRCA